MICDRGSHDHGRQRAETFAELWGKELPPDYAISASQRFSARNRPCGSRDGRPISTTLAPKSASRLVAAGIVTRTCRICIAVKRFVAQVERSMSCAEVVIVDLAAVLAISVVLRGRTKRFDRQDGRVQWN
jgi:hypothetical protein